MRWRGFGLIWSSRSITCGANGAICCRKMIDVYTNAGTLHTPGDVRQILENEGPEALDQPARLSVITALFVRMNNVLYRQQGLSWAAQAAQRLGLKLAVYGNGWEEHP